MDGIEEWIRFVRAANAAVPRPPDEPPRDHGLYGPGSVAWKVGRERVLILGGAATLLLQVAHPLIAAGVADHSTFRDDPFARLTGTLGPMAEITFGDRLRAEEAARRVARTHAGVTGSLRSRSGVFAPGTAYDARDPSLALWVHATLVSSAIRTYEAFVGSLSAEERSGFYFETKRQARLLGVTKEMLPATYADFRGYVEGMLAGPRLAVGEECRVIARDVLEPKDLPGAVAALDRVITAALLPERFRAEFGLRWTARERATFAALTRSSRLALVGLPARVRFWPHYLAARAA